MNSLSEKTTLPYLIQQGMTKRLWQGEVIDVKLISNSLGIIISSAGVELLDFDSQTIIWEFECPIQSAAINYNNSFLITSWNNKNYVWDLDQREFIHEFKPSSLDKYITSNITFAKDARTLAFMESFGDGSYSNLIFYDLINHKYKKELTIVKYVIYIAFSHDHKLVACLSEDNIITIHNLDEKQQIQSIKILREDIVDNFSLVFTPDSKQIIYAHGKTQNLYIYEVESGEIVQILENYTNNTEDIERGYYIDKISLVFSEDKKIFALGNNDGEARIWNFKNGEYVDTITVAETDDLISIEAISFSPDNSCLAFVDSNNRVQLWNLESKQKIVELQYTDDFRRPIISLSLSIFATINQKQIILWNLNSGEQIKKLEGGEDFYRNIAFNKNGEKIIATLQDGTVQLWDIKSETKIFSRTDRSYINAMIDPSDRFIAIVNNTYTKVEIWDIQSESCISIDKNSEFYLSSNITFSPNGQVILIEELSNMYSSDTISLWDVNTGGFLRRLTKITAHGLIFSPDGNLIAGESNYYDAAVLFDFNSGKQLKIFREENNYHNSEITCIAFSSDSKLLASASYDLTIRLWDIETGKQIKLIEGHTSTIFDIFFIDRDRTLVSVSADLTIKFWKI